MARRIIVLGSSGLLGSAVSYEAGKRNQTPLNLSRSNYPGFERALRSPRAFLESLDIRKGTLIVNALGITKQRIDEVSPKGKASASWLNTVFPFRLGQAAGELDAQVIQVGTDCVFSGNSGSYVETDFHDARDFYGISKSEGEGADSTFIIRSSFVGDSFRKNLGLWGWVKSQEPEAILNGYVNHIWNGVTTDALAKVIVGGFMEAIPFPRLQHLVPGDSVSKLTLIELIRRRIGREDITVRSVSATITKNMTLATCNDSMNQMLWGAAGFSRPPLISDLIERQRIFDG